MSETINLQAFRKIVNKFLTGDLSDLPEIMSSEYLDHQGFGDGVELIGHEGFKTVVNAVINNYKELDIQIVDIVENGNKLTARLYWKGIKKNGTVQERETIELMHFENGLAVEHWGGRSYEREIKL